MKTTGKIIVIAYPDTFVKMSTEFICKVLPYLGIGTKQYIKAGHAALILIENITGDAFYYDFGRYVTPQGKGRVRSAVTDYELHIPFKAKIDNQNKLQNLKQFLFWLDANPQKTHGTGRLIASVCDSIDFQATKKYIEQIQGRGSITYGAFDKQGSNCSRFVADAILAGNNHKKISKGLNRNKKFTPSTVGNIKRVSIESDIYEVYQGLIRAYRGSILKESTLNFFDKKVPATLSISPKILRVPKHYKPLPGMGSSAYFEFMKNTQLPPFYYRFKRFNELLQEDYDGVYYSEEFDKDQPFKVIYDSHCSEITIFQERDIVLQGKGLFNLFKIDKAI